MKQLFKRSYKSILKRGKVNDKTTIRDFVQKMQEELDEVKLAVKTEKLIEKVNEEIADLMNVCIVYFEHNKLDVKKELTKVIEKNEKRTD